MTRATFNRKEVILACEQSLREIYSNRQEKVEEAQVTLRKFITKVSNRSWWEAFLSDHWCDTFHVANLKDKILIENNRWKDQQNRLIDMIMFCNKIEDATIKIGIKEFTDFGYNLLDKSE